MADNRFNEDGNQSYTLEKLWEHHEEIIRLLALGYRPIAIARELKVHPQTVSNVRNNPLAQAKIRELQGLRDEETASITKRIRNMAPLALNVLEDALENASDNIEDEKSRSHGIASARTVLDHAIPKRVEKAVVHGHVTYAQIKKMKEEIEAERVANAKPVEVEKVA